MKRAAWILALIALAFVGVAGAQYTTKVVREQGGNKLTVLSGGEIEVQSGGTLDLQSGYTLSGLIARVNLATDTTQAYGIPVRSLQQTTGIPIVPAETAGNFNMLVSGNVISAQGEVTDNETEASVVQFQFVLPPEYVSGGAITLRLRCAIVKTGAAVDNASSIDASAYLQADGAVGADLVSTAAQTFAAVDTYYNKDFTITPTNLVAGNILNVVITSNIVDSEAGAGTLRFNMDPPKVLLSIKG